MAVKRLFKHLSNKIAGQYAVMSILLKQMFEEQMFEELS